MSDEEWRCNVVLLHSNRFTLNLAKISLILPRSAWSSLEFLACRQYMRVEANRLSSTTLDWDLRPLKHQVPLVSKDFCQAFQVVTKAPSFTSIFGAKMQMIFQKGSFSTIRKKLGEVKLFLGAKIHKHYRPTLVWVTLGLTIGASISFPEFPSSLTAKRQNSFWCDCHLIWFVNCNGSISRSRTKSREKLGNAAHRWRVKREILDLSFWWPLSTGWKWMVETIRRHYSGNFYKLWLDVRRFY